MAAPVAPTFADMLAAESDFVMPTDDQGVQAALTSFGAIFKKTRGDPHIATRADLLAGLALLHTHHLNLQPLVGALSIAQQQVLATALGLEFQAFGTDASWPAMLARRVIAHQAPGLTPKKRRPVSGGVDGQIRKPGDDGAQLMPPDDAAGQRPAKKAKKSSHPSPSSSSDSSATSSGSEADSVARGCAVVELMPDALGSGPAFNSLVASICARRWLTTNVMESVIPATYRPRLFRARLWPDKKRTAYDKMIRNQPSKNPAGRRREDPTSVAFPHRLVFAYSPDDGPELDAQHLRMVCDGERLSDWSGEEGRLLGGTSARTEYRNVLSELTVAWASVSGAIQRGEHVSAPASKNLTDLVLIVFERRYARFARVLPAGVVREEILANVARQFGELRAYFSAFDTSLADCASRMDYSKQARWVGNRLRTLFAPAVTLVLTPEGDGVADGPDPSAGGCGGYPGSPAAPSSAGKSPKGILKAHSPGVSFADGALPPTYNVPASAHLPLPAPGFPYFYPQQLHFADVGGPAPAAQPIPPPPSGGPAWGGWSGVHPGATAPPPATPAPPASRPPGVPIKTEPGPSRDKPHQGKRSRDGAFLSQPMHGYVVGEDLASVPAGACWKPVCGCRSHGPPGFNPGPHATWDCPYRYIQQCGHCPGFNPDGTKDLSQWLPGGTILTRAAKAKWHELISKHDLPLPHEAGARAPDFQK